MDTSTRKATSTAGGGGGATPSATSLGEEYGKLSVHVGHLQGKLLLLGLELELPESGVDDEGVGFGEETADLALANVQRV